jgi:hypothetical protein
MLLVVEPEHRDALETSPDFATLAKPRRAPTPSCLHRDRRPRSPRRFARSVLTQPASQTVARNPRLGFCRRARRRSPPAADAPRRPAACSRPAPLDQDLASQIESRRLLNPRATTAFRSRSDGSGSSQPESSQVKPSRPNSFAENTPSFLIFTKIPFHHRSFLTVQSFFLILAQNLFESLQISPYTIPKP